MELILSFYNETRGYARMLENQWRELKPYFDRVKSKSVKKYINQRQKKIKDQLSPHVQWRLIHKTRKSIKEIIYLSEIFGGYHKRKNRFYHAMSETIGELHDRQTLSKYLKENKVNPFDSQKN